MDKTNIKEYKPTGEKVGEGKVEIEGLTLKPNAYSDYKELINNLENDTVGDVYQQLMEKEQKRIDLINHVVDQKNGHVWSNTILYNQTLLEVAMNFAATWKLIFKEMYVERRFDRWFDIFYEGDRKIYVGLMIVVIALFMFFVSSSS